MKKYSENGFWVVKEEEGFRIGLSPKGQDDLGDVGFVEFLAQDTVSTDEEFIGVEASKAVTELTAPINGEVVEWHTELLKNPEFLNELADGKNWIAMITNVDESEFLNLYDTDGFTTPFVKN